MDDEETVKLRVVRKHICLAPEHHQDFLDSFICPNITEEARTAILSNGVEIQENTVHFPKGGIHPEHGRKMVMYPNENEEVVILRHWKLPDGTVVRHATDSNVLEIDKSEVM